jgi:hypothetical protein
MMIKELFLRNSMKRCDSFLYIGFGNENEASDNIPDYCEALREVDKERFIYDFNVSEEVIVLIGTVINPQAISIRLQRPFDYRQMTLPEIIRMKQIPTSIISEIIGCRKTVKKRGFFRRKRTIELPVIETAGKQMIADILNKKIIVYENPPGDFESYAPEKYSPLIMPS